MRRNGWQVTEAILVLLFIAAPQVISSWWYMFSSTPPYQWLQAKGIPTLTFSPLWITGPIGIVFLFLIWRQGEGQKKGLQKERRSHPIIGARGAEHIRGEGLTVKEQVMEHATRGARALDKAFDESSVAQCSNKTPIEAIDELLIEGKRLEQVFASDDPFPENQHQQWLSDVKICLRIQAPLYVDRFNESVRLPRPPSHFPLTGRTIEELAAWIQDKPRCDGWSVIASALQRLKETRRNLYSKLP